MLPLPNNHVRAAEMVQAGGGDKSPPEKRPQKGLLIDYYDQELQNKETQGPPDLKDMADLIGLLDV